MGLSVTFIYVCGRRCRYTITPHTFPPVQYYMTCYLVILASCLVGIHHILFSDARYMQPLNTILIDTNWGRITGWSISHLVWFYILGRLCPNNYALMLSKGVLWEVVEKVYGRVTDNEQYWTSNGINGQCMDIIMNCLGYHLAHI